MPKKAIGKAKDFPYTLFDGEIWWENEIVPMKLVLNTMKFAGVPPKTSQLRTDTSTLHQIIGRYQNKITEANGTRSKKGGKRGAYKRKMQTQAKKKLVKDVAKAEKRIRKEVTDEFTEPLEFWVNKVDELREEIANLTEERNKLGKQAPSYHKKLVNVSKTIGSIWNTEIE